MLPPTERFAANYFWAQLCGQLNFVTQHFENIKGLLAVLALLIICHSLTTLKEPQKPRRTLSISQCLEWTEFRIVLVLKWHVCPKQLLWLEVVTEKSALKAIFLPWISQYQVIRGIYQALLALDERDNDDYDVEDDKVGGRYDEDGDSDVICILTRGLSVCVSRKIITSHFWAERRRRKVSRLRARPCRP